MEENKDTEERRRARTNRKARRGDGAAQRRRHRGLQLDLRAASQSEGEWEEKNTVYFSVTKQFQGKRLQLFDNMTTKKERFDGKKTKKQEKLTNS